MITDEQLLRDTRPVDVLARALLAPTLVRYARLRLGVRVYTKAQAIAAITQAQAAIQRDTH